MIKAWDRAIRTYQGNQEIDIPIITLFNDGPSAAVMAIGSINGGNAKKPSVILIIISSIRLLATPANIPIGTPIKTEKNTTPNATFNE